MLFEPLKIFVPVALGSFALAMLKFTADVYVVVEAAEQFSLSLFFSNKILSASTVVLLLSSLQFLLIGMVADGICRKIAPRLPLDTERLRRRSHTPPGAGD